MPELPEVETVRRGLEMTLKGAVIHKVTLRRKDLRIPFPKGLTETLESRQITGIGRRAKYLLFALDSDDTLIAHLGMSGRFSVEPQTPKAFASHDHAVFVLEDGRAVIYNDVRRFGLMALVKTDRISQHPLLSELGPEPLGRDFTPAYLKEELARRRSPIKTALMDQSLVVGVGNIYASEALFLAGIDPRKPAKSVAFMAKELVGTIRRVLGDAIASGGSSLRDFLHVSGETGYFQHHFNVYGRKGQRCFACHHPIRIVRQSGRSTFFCAHCQK